MYVIADNLYFPSGIIAREIELPQSEVSNCVIDTLVTP
jgi:hypothetical protein